MTGLTHFTPLFQFALLLVVPGALGVLLVALLWRPVMTGRRFPPPWTVDRADYAFYSRTNIRAGADHCHV
jgi:hypothetical protein